MSLAVSFAPSLWDDFGLRGGPRPDRSLVREIVVAFEKNGLYSTESSSLSESKAVYRFAVAKEMEDFDW